MKKNYIHPVMAFHHFRSTSMYCGSVSMDYRDIHTTENNVGSEENDVKGASRNGIWD